MSASQRLRGFASRQTSVVITLCTVLAALMCITSLSFAQSAVNNVTFTSNGGFKITASTPNKGIHLGGQAPVTFTIERTAAGAASMGLFCSPSSGLLVDPKTVKGAKSANGGMGWNYTTIIETPLLGKGQKTTITADMHCPMTKRAGQQVELVVWDGTNGGPRGEIWMNVENPVYFYKTNGGGTDHEETNVGMVSSKVTRPVMWLQREFGGIDAQVQMGNSSIPQNGTAHVTYSFTNKNSLLSTAAVGLYLEPVSGVGVVKNSIKVSGGANKVNESNPYPTYAPIDATVNVPYGKTTKLEFDVQCNGKLRVGEEFPLFGYVSIKNFLSARSQYIYSSMTVSNPVTPPPGDPHGGGNNTTLPVPGSANLVATANFDKTGVYNTGESVSLQAVIRNVGTASWSGSIKLSSCASFTWGQGQIIAKTQNGVSVPTTGGGSASRATIPANGSITVGWKGTVKSNAASGVVRFNILADSKKLLQVSTQIYNPADDIEYWTELYVDGTASPASPKKGEAFTLTARVKNSGNETAWDKLSVTVPSTLQYVPNSIKITPDPSTVGAHALDFTSGVSNVVKSNNSLVSPEFGVRPNSTTTISMKLQSSTNISSTTSAVLSLLDSSARNTVTLNFASPYVEPAPYVEVQPGGTGTLRQVGDANSGWTFTVTPSAGYEVDRWESGSGSAFTQQGTNSIYTRVGGSRFTVWMKEVKKETPPKAQVVPEGAGDATVSDNGNGLYTLSATPRAGYSFSDWEEANGSIITYSNSCTRTADGKTYIARFDKDTPAPEENKKPSVSADPSNAGTVAVEDLGNNQYRLTAIANDGYKFKNWKNSYGMQVSSNTPYVVTGVAGLNYVANFVEAPAPAEDDQTSAPVFATAQKISDSKVYGNAKYTLSLSSGDLHAGDTVHGTLRIERTTDVVPTDVEKFGIAVQTPYLKLMDNSLTLPQGAKKSSQANYNAVLENVSVTYGQPLDIGFDALVTESVTDAQVVGITVAHNLDGLNGVQTALNVSPKVTEKICTCATKCTEGNMNAQCDVCSQEGATPDLCRGVEPKEPGVNIRFESTNLVARPFEKAHMKVLMDAVNTTEPVKSGLFVDLNSKYFSIDPVSVKLNNLSEPKTPISVPLSGTYDLVVPPVEVAPTNGDASKQPSIEFDLYVLAKAEAKGSSLISASDVNTGVAKATCLVEFQESAIQPNLTEYSGISNGVSYTATLSSANPCPGEAVDVNLTVQRLTDDTSPQAIAIATDADSLILDKNSVTVKNAGDDASVADVFNATSNADSQIFIEDAVPKQADGAKTYTIHGYVSPLAKTGNLVRVQVMPESSLNAYAPLSFTVGQTPAITPATHAERTFGNTKMDIDLDRDSVVSGGVVNATVTLTPLNGSTTDAIMVDVPSTASIDIYAATIRVAGVDCAQDGFYKSDQYDLIVPEVKASAQEPAVVKFQIVPESAATGDILPVFVRSGEAGMNIQYAAFQMSEALEPVSEGVAQDDSTYVRFTAPSGTLKQGETVPFQIYVKNKTDEPERNIVLKVDTAGMYHVIAGWTQRELTDFELSTDDVTAQALPAEGQELVTEGQEDLTAASTATESYMPITLHGQQPTVVDFQAKINENLDVTKLYNTRVTWANTLKDTHDDSLPAADLELAPAVGALSASTVKADGVQMSANIYQSNLDAGAAARVVMNLSKAIDITAPERDVVFTTAEGLTPDISTVEVKTSGEYTIPPEQLSPTSFQLRSLPVADEATEVSFVVNLASAAEEASVLPVTVDAGNGAVTAVNVLVDPNGLEPEPCKHEWGDWQVTIDPTCTQAGTKMHVCNLCQNKEFDTVPPLGHDFQNGKCTRCSVVQSDLRKADNSKLIQRLADVETLDRDAYSIASWDNLLDAQAQAEEVASNADALQQQIDHTLDGLNAAILGLVPVEDGMGVEPNPSAPDVPEGQQPGAPEDNNGQTPSDPEDQSGKEGEVPENHDGDAQNQNQGTTPETEGNNGQGNNSSGNAGNNSGSAANQQQNQNQSTGGTGNTGNQSGSSKTESDKQSTSQNGSSVKKPTTSSGGNTLTDLAAQAQSSSSKSSGTTSGPNTSATTTNSVTAPIVGSTTSPNTGSSTGLGSGVSSTGTPSSSTYTSSTTSTPVTSKVASKMPQTGIPAVASIAAGIGVAAVVAVIARKKLRG